MDFAMSSIFNFFIPYDKMNYFDLTLIDVITMITNNMITP